MAGFQFLHINTYGREKSRKASKGKERKWTVRDIAGEVERDPENSPHVEEPKPPNLLHGMMPKAAVAEAETRAAESTDSMGRKIRKDGAILLAGVASHPFTVADLKDPEKRAEYEHWRGETLGFMKRKYGENLLSVVEHLDEEHPHLHFYAAPKAGVGFNAKSIHDGFKAADGAKDPKEQKRLYCEGMRRLQDAFHQQVSVKTGQDRLGPKRQRLTRAEWVEKQTTLTAAATAWRKLAERIKAKFRKGYAEGFEAGKAKASKPAEKLAAMWDGITGHRRRLEREHAAKLAEAKRKAKDRVERETKAREEADARYVRERMKNSDTVSREVALRTAPLEMRLKREQEKSAGLAQQLETLSAEAMAMRQQLKPQQRGPGGPSMGGGKR